IDNDMAHPKVLFKIMNPESDWDKVSLEEVVDVVDLKETIKKEVYPVLNAYSVCQLVIRATKIEDKEADNATEQGGEKKLVDILNDFMVPYSDVSIKESFAENIRLFVYVRSALISGVSGMGEMLSEIGLQVVPKKRSYKEAIGIDRLVVISEERLSEFNRQWDLYKIILLRSPPGSGKTTFAKWIELNNKDHVRVVRRISMSHLNRISGAFENENIFNASWKRFAGETWTNCLHSTTPTDILIDEAQILYCKAAFFWNDIKNLQDRPNHNLRVILLSMYSDCPTVNGGENYTPIEFQHALGIEQLHNVRDAIFNATAGHPHLVRKSLRNLKSYCRRGNNDAIDMLLYLVSCDYFCAIEKTRVFDWLKNLELTSDDANFLRNAYYKVDSASTFTFDPHDQEMYQTAKKFKRSGLITEALEERFQFAAPIVRIILGTKLFKARTSLTQSIAVVMRVRLIERQWQIEWLLAATSAVPTGNSINPDVGQVYGTPGYLDFYINGKLNWGVELMREGKKMADHIDRFGNEGRNKNIPFDRWAIIDFRHNSNVPKKLEPNVWYALYADNYKTITVRRQGHEDVILNLCGDSSLSSFQST
ncbi:36548_t:CDS:2, partial [Racocetra persica]